MSNDRTVKLINDQIFNELRTLNSFMTDEDDKPAIMQRIADLKAMLDSDSLPKKDQPPTVRELISEIITAIRDRNTTK